MIWMVMILNGGKQYNYVDLIFLVQLNVRQRETTWRFKIIVVPFRICKCNRITFVTNGTKKFIIYLSLSLTIFIYKNRNGNRKNEIKKNCNFNEYKSNFLFYNQRAIITELLN